MPASKHKQQQHSDGTLSLLAALDTRLSNRLYRAGLAVPRRIYRALEWGGDGLVWLALALAALLAPGASLSARTFWANFLLAWAVDLMLVGALKGIVRRSRPVYNQASDFLVVVAVDHYSFPSGHSSRASFVAGLACVAVARTHPALAAAAVAWAACTALSRALMGRHYLFDVMAGLALGGVTAAIVTGGTFQHGGLLLSPQHVRTALGALAGKAAAAGWPLPWLAS